MSPVTDAKFRLEKRPRSWGNSKDIKMSNKITRTGKYGGREGERRYLERKFKVNMRGGKDMQFEHPITSRTARFSSGLKRNQGRRARMLDDEAPSYAEQTYYHRLHIGTGSGQSRVRRRWNAETKDVNDSGFVRSRSSDPDEILSEVKYPGGTRLVPDYDRTIRSVLENTRSVADGAVGEGEGVADAYMLNLVDYAHIRGFQGDQSADAQAADDSYFNMASELNVYTYAQGSENVTVRVDQVYRDTITFGRRMARTGKWPVEQVKEYNARIKPGQMTNQSSEDVEEEQEIEELALAL